MASKMLELSPRTTGNQSCTCLNNGYTSRTGNMHDTKTVPLCNNNCSSLPLRVMMLPVPGKRSLDLRFMTIVNKLFRKIEVPILELTKIDQSLKTTLISPLNDTPLVVPASLEYLQVFNTFIASVNDFYNTASDYGLRTVSFGELCMSASEAGFYTRLPTGIHVITRVVAPSDNMRSLALRVIHAWKVCNYFTNPLTFQFQADTGEGPSTQSPEDKLDTTEVTHVAQNTTITKEVDDSSNVIEEDDNTLQLVSTTTDLISLPELTSRFIRIIEPETHVFSTTDTVNQVIYTLDLPSGLYRFMDTTIATGLRNFTLIKTDVEIIIKVNANQAQCGRYVISHWSCYDQLNNENLDSVYRMLQRDHAIIDISVSNDVHYIVKYENLRPFLPIQTNEIGEMIGANFARFAIRCLSPLRISDTGNPRCPFQIIAKLRDVTLTGMRYPVPLETTTRYLTRSEIEKLLQRGGIESNPGPVHFMVPGVLQADTSRFDSTLRSTNQAISSIPIVGSIWKILGSVMGNTSLALGKMLGSSDARINQVESRLKYIGMINKDRPVDISHPTPLLPQPVHAYSYGRGAYSSKKLRLEPEVTTPHLYSHKVVETTQDILSIARTPGFFTSFLVSTNNSQGDLLIELPCAPYDPRYVDLIPTLGVDPVGGTNIKALPPLTYISGMYQYYSGSLVYDFVPVKTPSHNFSIQVAYVPFNGTPLTTTDEQMQSCEWKTIDFRSSASSSFEVPWVSTNPMRMWPHPDCGIASANSVSWSSGTYLSDTGEVYGMTDPGKVIVRMVNELNPTPIVSPTIEVLVFVRAHDNLRFLSPQNQRFPPEFPPSYVQVERSAARPGTVNQPCLHNLPVTPFDYEMGRLEADTTNFQIGDEQTPVPKPLRQAFGPQIQSMEKHDNLIDVSRRFYYHTTVTGAPTTARVDDGTGAIVERHMAQIPFYSVFPATVYAHNPYVSSEPGVFQLDRYRSHTLPTNPRDAIAMCFRWSRGSINYVFHNISDIPVEISYRPPIDVPVFVTGGLLGELRLNRLSNENTPFNISVLPIYGMPNSSGAPTEVLEPRLNPIQTLEVPFYNVNNYNDLQAPLYDVYNATAFDRTADDYPRQDLASYTQGNIIVKQLKTYSNAFLARDGPDGFPNFRTADNTFKIRVSSAIGDDFQFYHFMGVPPVLQGPGTTWTMTQQPITRVRTREEIVADLLASGIESNPGPFFFKTSSPELEAGFSGIFSNTAAVFSELKSLVTAPKRLVEQIDEFKSGGFTLMDSVERIFATYTLGIELVDIVALSTAVISALSEGANSYSVVTAFVLVLKATGILCAESVTKIMRSFIEKIVAGRKQATLENGESDGLAIGVVSALVLEVLTTSLSDHKKEYDSNYVMNVIKKHFLNFNFARAGAICIFFTKFANVLKYLWNNVVYWVKGTNKYNLLDKDPNFIRKFMIDYSFLMNEQNLSSISMIQQNKDRYWTTVITAYYLKSLLAVASPKDRNPALLTAVNEVIRKANEVNSFMSAPPVRYEPFVLWIYGEPGVGKSTLVSDLTIDMAKDIGCSYDGDPIYVRSPHSTFWNGWAGQPIVHIDDANGVQDPKILGQMVSEFQAMKTSARMRVEMPRLEEKNAEVTSLIMSVCSNLPGWSSSMIVDSGAFNRRRDYLARFEFSEKALKWFKDNGKHKRVASELPEEFLEDNKHITAYYIPNPFRMKEEIAMPYIEFVAHLRDHHQRYFNREQDRMMARYRKSLSLSKQFASRVTDHVTLKAAVMATLLGGESSEVMSETLQRTMLELKTAMPSRFRALPKHTQDILETLSGVLEAPRVESQFANVVQHASPFVRSCLPQFSVDNGSFMSQLRPWTIEESLQINTDNFNSPCSICRENFEYGRGIRMLCPASVAENQHWICSNCFPSAPSHHCPVCRNENTILITNVENRWYWYNKLKHVASVFGKLTVRPIVATLDMIWDNAFWVTYACFLIAIVGVNYVDLSHRIHANDEINNATHAFIEQYGVVPQECLRSERGIIFSLDGQAYRNTEEGYMPIINTTLQGGKKNKIHLSPTNGKEQLKDPENSDSDQDGFHDIPDERSVLNPKPSTSALRKREECFMPSDTTPVTICHVNHGNVSQLLHIIRQSYPNALPTAYEDEGMWYYHFNDPEHSEIGEIKVPVQRCESVGCVVNTLMNLIHNRYVEYLYNLQKNVPLDENSLLTITEDVRETLPEYIVSQIIEPGESRAPTRCERFVQIQQDFLATLKGWFLSAFQKVKELICDKWKWIIAAIAVIAATYYGYKYIVTEEEGVVVQLEYGSSIPSLSRSTATTRSVPNRNPRVDHRNHLQGPSVNKEPPPQVKAILDLISKQVMSFEVGGVTLSGIIIANNLAIVPRHSMHFVCAAFGKGKNVTLTTPSVSFLIPQSDSLGLRIIYDRPDLEFIIFQHPRITGKNIIHHFYSSPLEDIVYPPFAFVYDVSTGKYVPSQIFDAVSSPDPIEMPMVVQQMPDFKYNSEFKEYMTTSFAGSGRCGSLYVSSPHGKIIGMHIAGMSSPKKVGYAATLLQTDLDLPILKKPDPSVKVGDGALEADVNDKDFMTWEATVHRCKLNDVVGIDSDMPNMTWIGMLPKAPYHTEKSKIRRSYIYDIAWESVTEPCIQSINDPRWIFTESPLVSGASTIGEPTIPPEPDALMAAVSAVSRELLSVMPSLSSQPPVSVFEAVAASQHIHVESMNLATSAGIPLIMDNPSLKRKSDYIDHRVIGEKHSVKLINGFNKMYHTLYEMRKEGIPPHQPFWAHCKDELRKPTKARSYGGTRVFSVSPLEQVLTSRRVLLPFMDAFHADPVRAHHGIGIAPDSPQWTELIEHLRSKGNRVIQLDFKKFSDTLPWDFVAGAFSIVKEYYARYGALTKEVSAVLDTLYIEMTSSYLCVDKDVFQINNGVLQGHPITSIINSIVNLIEQTYVWIKITNLPGTDFFKYCGIHVMGDDVVITLPLEMINKGYNAKTIVEEFAKMKIVVTDEDKNTENIKPSQDISRLSFMSRSYYLHPYRHLYLAPTDPESIFDTPLWIRNPESPFQDETRENMSQSLSLMYSHGPMMYEMYRALLEYMLPGYSFRTWFDLDYLFMRGEGIPGRSVIDTNLGIVTGTSSKTRELLGASVGRIGSFSGENTSQYHSYDLLRSCELDITKVDFGRYKCRCRYECEQELMNRITQVEIKTNTTRKNFLPFTTQDEGAKILSARLDAIRLTRMPRGYTSTIAFQSLGGVPSGPPIGTIDGEKRKGPTNGSLAHYKDASSVTRTLQELGVHLK